MKLRKIALLGLLGVAGSAVSTGALAVKAPSVPGSFSCTCGKMGDMCVLTTKNIANNYVICPEIRSLIKEDNYFIDGAPSPAAQFCPKQTYQFGSAYTSDKNSVEFNYIAKGNCSADKYEGQTLSTPKGKIAVPILTKGKWKKGQFGYRCTSTNPSDCPYEFK